ncbi:immunoprevalent protein [Volepox virus]|uniref:Protein A47 n=1 Tax=Volepox virus TaxID=28874 RepID=A0A1C9KCJ9_9POXV|nr:immunoprevalent protein [Volepox virus]AOP31858.1 immunoprevalent protein [Volepox virus]
MGNNIKPSKENRQSLSKENRQSLKKNRQSFLFNDGMDTFKRGSWATSSFREKSASTIHKFSSLRREHTKIDQPDSKFIELKREIYEIINKSSSIDIDKRIMLVYNIKKMMVNPFMIEGLMNSLEKMDPEDVISYSSVMIFGEFDMVNIHNKSAFQFINSLLKSLHALNNKQLKLLEYSISNDLLYNQVTALEYVIKNTFDVPERQLILRGQYLTPIFNDLLKYSGLTIKSNILMWNKKFIKPISDLYTAIRLLYCVTV